MRLTAVEQGEVTDAQPSSFKLQNGQAAFVDIWLFGALTESE